ncbi:hypothetical protein RLOC_00007598 [Lonchura striata]|uniref:Uncharacterized protein n=1 Tax=Lonchura striata TaxID=40157 RepID=A0A218UWT9_9PASE|nr:hypothetical protein RLOC_00007598 [Lonchura striata domestica]
MPQDASEPPLHPRAGPAPGQLTSPDLSLFHFSPCGSQSQLLLGEQDSRLLGEQDARLLGEQDARLLGEQDARLLGEQDSRLLGEQNSRLLGEQNSRLLGEQDSRLLGEQNSRLLGEQDARLLGEQNSRVLAGAAGRQPGQAEQPAAPGLCNGLQGSVSISFCFLNVGMLEHFTWEGTNLAMGFKGHTVTVLHSTFALSFRPKKPQKDPKTKRKPNKRGVSHS